MTRRVTWSSGTAGWQKIVVGLRVYFAEIQSLFAFILLTHKIMILICIGAGYIGHCVESVDGSFYFVTIKKGKMKTNLVECVQL